MSHNSPVRSALHRHRYGLVDDGLVFSIRHVLPLAHAHCIVLISTTWWALFVQGSSIWSVILSISVLAPAWYLQDDIGYRCVGRRGCTATSAHPSLSHAQWLGGRGIHAVLEPPPTGRATPPVGSELNLMHLNRTELLTLIVRPC